MKPFRERNTAVVGLVTGGILLALLVGALEFTKLPFTQGTMYHASLVEAGQLGPGENVTIAGVKVGTTKGVKLQGDHVRLDFQVNRGTHFGPDSTLAVKVLSALGQEYVQITSKGAGTMPAGGTIALSHTSGTGTLNNTLGQLGSTVGTIDQAQLAQSLQVVNNDLSTTDPAATAAVINGLGRLSTVINNRAAQLSQLVGEAKTVTATLDQHKGQLVSLVNQADQILQVVLQRRADIANLLATVTSLAKEISSLITSKTANLGSLLANLNTVSAVLAKDSSDLADLVPLAAGLSKYTANASGNGPYFDGAAPTLLLPDTVVAACDQPGAVTNSPALGSFCQLDKNGNVEHPTAPLQR